jgi:hypothetical protein
MLTLEKFEEASEVVGKVTWKQSLYTVSIFLLRLVIRCILSRKTCNIQGPIK